MYAGFVERARAVEQLLHDRRTTFAVVTTLEGAPLREAERFCEELVRRGFHLGALVLNKTLPETLLSAEGRVAAERLEADAHTIAKTLADTGAAVFADPARTARVLRTSSESFRNFSVVANRERELRQELARLPEVVVDVPSFESDIADLTGLARIGTCLFGGKPARGPADTVGR
jgi:anion-transporting  ArsA/GET3 family ATPase